MTEESLYIQNKGKHLKIQNRKRGEKMKKLIMVILLVALVAVPVAMAETTGNGNYEQRFMNNRLTRHNHNYTDTNTHADYNIPGERDFEWGTGLDLVLFETKDNMFAVEAQNKYDFGNNEYSVYLTGKVHVWDLFNKK